MTDEKLKELTDNMKKLDSIGIALIQIQADTLLSYQKMRRHMQKQKQQNKNQEKEPL